MIDSTQRSTDSANITQPSLGPTSGRPRGSRLEQAIRGKARAAIRKREEVVHVFTSIRTTRSLPASDAAGDYPSAMLLDTELVTLSRWANRHAQSYLSAAFLDLKRSIQHDGGNQVPILVRPVQPTPGSHPSAPYELVYGHRRLQACRELGLPVRAIVEDVPEGRRLVERMHAENRGRESLSAYETGVFYKRLVSEGLYASQRKLAIALGVDQADVSRKIWLASLPTAVIQVFRSPIEISCDDAKRLQPAWNRDPEAMQRHAQSLLDSERELPAKQIISKLVAGSTSPGDGASNTRDQHLVEIRASTSAGTTIKVKVRLTPAEQRRLRCQIEAFVATCGSGSPSAKGSTELAA